MTVVKKCETCEQRWEAFYGALVVDEITISHETDKTVTKYVDRGPLGASTVRQYKESEHWSIHKSPLEAWQAVAAQAKAKATQYQAYADQYKASLAKAEAKCVEYAG